MISIIYVYYNSADVIFDSINSILVSKAKVEYEIIITINKCTDINLKELKRLSERITIIENEDNFGFGKANNVGAKYSRGKYLLILNPDTLLREGVLDKMYQVMEADNDIGGSICKLVDSDNRIQETVIRKNLNFTFLLIQLYFLYKIPILNKVLIDKYYYSEEEFFEEQSPDVISGAFMFLRKEIFMQVNGFDEEYFMYVEDIDLSKRMKEISKLFYFPNATVVHIGDTTLGSKSLTEKLRMNYTSLFYFINKFYGRKRLILFKLLLFINGLLFFPFSIFIKKENIKMLISKRSKLFLNVFDKGFYNA